MSSFVKTTLGECCDIVSGATPNTNDERFWGGSVYWATPKDLSNLDGKCISETPRTLTKIGLESCSAAILPANSVLFSSRAPIGHVAINSVPMATNQGFKSFVPKGDKVNSDYLYYWLKAKKSYLESLGNGATFKEVSKAVVSRVEILLPSFEEQKRIADIFDKADNLRLKRRQAIEKINSLSQAIFFEMFGDPNLNTKKWPLATIADIALQITDGEHQTPRRTSSGIKLLSARNVRDGFLDFSDVDYIDEAEYLRISKRCNPVKGDILISCSGTIGRVAQVPGVERLSLVRSAALVRPNQSKVTSTFLEYYLRTPQLKTKMINSSKSSSQANLFQAPIKKLPVYCPPLKLQETFGKKIDGLNIVKASLEISIEQFLQLAQSIQAKYFYVDRGVDE